MGRKEGRRKGRKKGRKVGEAGISFRTSSFRIRIYVERMVSNLDSSMDRSGRGTARKDGSALRMDRATMVGILEGMCLPEEGKCDRFLTRRRESR